MNSIGQNLGSFIGFIGFLALNNPETCNSELFWSGSGLYLRSIPSDEPIVTLGSFLSFFGWALLATTITVAMFRPEVDDGHADTEMGLTETYATVAKVLRLPTVQRLGLVLLTCRAAFACADNVTSLKMIEYLPRPLLHCVELICHPDPSNCH
jgi:PAT family acetyl-CoA transporter-like MFS transporter 1